MHGKYVFTNTSKNTHNNEKNAPYFWMEIESVIKFCGISWFGVFFGLKSKQTEFRISINNIVHDCVHNCIFHFYVDVHVWCWEHPMDEMKQTKGNNKMELVERQKRKNIDNMYYEK